jgi:phage gpG-like protein
MATERSATGKGHASKTEASQLTNVEIGIAHEYGVKGGMSGGWKIPPRSFLFTPLSMHLMDYVNEKASVINRYLNMAEVKNCYDLLGVIAENVVQEGFETGGFGAWPKLKDATIARKGSDSILIDTGQLRKSITSRVVAD